MEEEKRHLPDEIVGKRVSITTRDDKGTNIFEGVSNGHCLMNGKRYIHLVDAYFGDMFTGENLAKEFYVLTDAVFSVMVKPLAVEKANTSNSRIEKIKQLDTGKDPKKLTPYNLDQAEKDMKNAKK